MPRRQETPDVKLSKGMSYLLRHAAVKEKLEISQDGYVKVDDMLKHNRCTGASFADVQRVVDTNEKKRFAMKEDNGVWYIRANQGHSLEVEVPYKRLERGDFPAAVIHGTNPQAWEIIKNQGLKTMKRNHIHLAKGKFGEEGVISGMRKSAKVLIYIDIDKAIDRGVVFEESENGVILTKGIDGVISPDLFLRVE